MDCRTVHNHLSAYLDQDVPMPTRALLDSHFALCPHCRRELTQFQTMTAWVRDFPAFEPSASFSQQLAARLEELRHHPFIPLFRRLTGALPLRMAAALAVTVSAALLWQIAPYSWQRQAQPPEVPAKVQPWTSRENPGLPAADTPPVEHMFDEPPPTSTPLVQAPVRRPVFTLREEPWRVKRDVAAMPMFTGLQSEAHIGDVIPPSSLVLRTADPVQAVQQLWDIVPHLGGVLLHSQGMAVPASRGVRGPVKITLSLAVAHYQALLDAIRQLPGTTVVEEHMALVGRELSPQAAATLRRLDPAQAALVPKITLVIAILPR